MSAVFDAEILEALKSDDPEIHAEAIEAAGNWQVAAAWPHVVSLVRAGNTPKDLLLPAIAAVASIRPAEARRVLQDFTRSDDEDIAEAALDAMGMADAELGFEEEEDDEDEDEGDWVN